MKEREFPSAECLICGEIRRKWSNQRSFYCDRHERDEIDFHQALPDRELTKTEKEQMALYRRRWDTTRRRKFAIPFIDESFAALEAENVRLRQLGEVRAEEQGGKQ